MKVGVKLNNIEVFFSRPGEMSEIKDRLLIDIKYAKNRLYVAMAFNNDYDILKSINSTNEVVEKKFVFNCSDKIYSYIEKLSSTDIVMLGNEVSFMHHKFWIIDDVVWIGSFNSTINAAEAHWENIMRIEQPEITKKFIEEFNKMYIIGKIIYERQQQIFEILRDNKGNFKTICNTCKDSEKYKYINNREGIIETDVWNHYNFYIEHLSTANLQNEIININFYAYCIRDDEEKAILDGRIRNTKGICNFCNEISPKNSLIKTIFININREIEGDFYGNSYQKDTNIAQSEYYNFCTKCIFDALNNYYNYKKYEVDQQLPVHTLLKN